MSQEEKRVLSFDFTAHRNERDPSSLELFKHQEKEEEVDMKTKIGFGFGHVLNDISSGSNAGYALLFFTTVIRISNVHAGLIFMIANIADAFGVVAAGLIIDLDIKCRIYDLYGKLKSWHLVGSICLLVTYILLYLPPLSIEVEELITAYYTSIYVIQSLGYSTIAIAYNSIISKLATSEKDQVTMSTIKNSARAIALITLYWVAYFCFRTSEDGDLSTTEFTVFVSITSVVGVSASILFHVLVKEAIPDVSKTQQRARCESESFPILRFESFSISNSTMTKSKWLTEANFYIVILIYAVSRTFFSVSMTYLVFFVQYTLLLEKSYLAIAPLTMVISGLVVSLPIKKIINSYGLEKSLILFGIVGVVACTWIWFGCISKVSVRFEAIGASAFLGISSYSMLVASLALVVRLIGRNVGKYFLIRVKLIHK